MIDIEIEDYLDSMILIAKDLMATQYYKKNVMLETATAYVDISANVYPEDLETFEYMVIQELMAQICGSSVVRYSDLSE